MNIEDIKNYIEENNIVIEDIDLGENEISDIKADPIKLSEFYVKYFNEFCKVMKDCDDENVRKIVYNKDIFLELIKYNSKFNGSCEFGKSFWRTRLERYVRDKYDDIVWFFDLYNEVKG